MAEFVHISDILKSVLEDMSKGNFERLTDNFSEEEKREEKIKPAHALAAVGE